MTSQPSQIALLSEVVHRRMSNDPSVEQRRDADWPLVLDAEFEPAMIRSPNTHKRQRRQTSTVERNTGESLCLRSHRRTKYRGKAFIGIGEFLPRAEKHAGRVMVWRVPTGKQRSARRYTHSCSCRLYTGHPGQTRSIKNVYPRRYHRRSMFDSVSC